MPTSCWALLEKARPTPEPGTLVRVHVLAGLNARQRACIAHQTTRQGDARSAEPTKRLLPRQRTQLPRSCRGSRFLEVDPVEGGSANDYDYVGGDPVNGQDLDGRTSCLITASSTINRLRGGRRSMTFRIQLRCYNAKTRVASGDFRTEQNGRRVIDVAGGARFGVRTYSVQQTISCGGKNHSNCDGSYRMNWNLNFASPGLRWHGAGGCTNRQGTFFCHGSYGTSVTGNHKYGTYGGT